MNRRDFLLGAAAASVASAETTRPSEILYNGNIYAAPEGIAFRTIQALAIVEGKIAAAGGNAEYGLWLDLAQRRPTLQEKPSCLASLIRIHTSGSSGSITCDPWIAISALLPTLRRPFVSAPLTRRKANGSAGIRTGFGNDWVRVGGMKLVCDGSISERTARMSQPYIGRSDDYGILFMPETELYEQACKAHLAGWQVGIHANGDVAIDIALRVYERLSREHPRPNARFRVEHCTLINDDLLKRIKALDVIPTPFWTMSTTTAKR